MQIALKGVRGLKPLRKLLNLRQVVKDGIVEHIDMVEALRTELPYSLLKAFWVQFTYLTLDPERAT